MEQPKDESQQVHVANYLAKELMDDHFRNNLAQQVSEIKTDLNHPKERAAVIATAEKIGKQINIGSIEGGTTNINMY